MEIFIGILSLQDLCMIGREVEVVFGFFELLYSQRVRHGGEDKICCIPSKRKSIEVKSLGVIYFGKVHFSLEEYLES